MDALFSLIMACWCAEGSYSARFGVHGTCQYLLSKSWEELNLFSSPKFIQRVTKDRQRELFTLGYFINPSKTNDWSIPSVLLED